MTVWVTFPDEAAFRMFHDAACAEHGIPFPGVDLGTYEYALEGQWTTAYVDPWIVGLAREIMAEVPAEDVDTYRLTPAKDPPVFPSGDPDEPAGELAPPSPPEWDWHQPVPDPPVWDGPPTYVPDRPIPEPAPDKTRL